MSDCAYVYMHVLASAHIGHPGVHEIFELVSGDEGAVVRVHVVELREQTFHVQRDTELLAHLRKLLQVQLLVFARKIVELRFRCCLLRCVSLGIIAKFLYYHYMIALVVFASYRFEHIQETLS